MLPDGLDDRAVLHVELGALDQYTLTDDVKMIVVWRCGAPVASIVPPADRQSADWRRLAAEAPTLESIRRASAITDAPRLEASASVVICTRDRPDHLRQCLASMVRQTLQPAEIIVVDNASVDDRTRQVAAAAGVVYVREPRPGLDIARNAGARHATGDFIAYTDDDVILNDTWLERLIRGFEHDNVMAVAGLVLPAELSTFAQEAFESRWSFNRGYSPIEYGPEFFACDERTGCPAWVIGAGASMAFRKRCFTHVGWFDERLDVGAAGCSGDSEYWHRILSKGYSCRYEPSSVAFHVHRRDLEGLSSQIFAYMRGHAAALLVQYERTGNVGNLRRLVVTTPVWYLKRLTSRILRGRSDAYDRFLRQEIAGFISGIVYYLATPRARAGDAP